MRVWTRLSTFFFIVECDSLLIINWLIYYSILLVSLTNISDITNYNIIQITLIKMTILKIVQIVNLGVLQTLGLSYSLNLPKYDINRSSILMAVSTVLFYSLCVDLARD